MRNSGKIAAIEMKKQKIGGNLEDPNHLNSALTMTRGELQTNKWTRENCGRMKSGMIQQHDGSKGINNIGKRFRLKPLR